MEDLMQCSICLEPFKVPVTIPCGHSFCKSCISTFWEGKEKDVHCPVCQETFNLRPQLKRNVSMSVLTEMTSTQSSVKSDVCTGGAESAEPAEVCERHQIPLDTYCKSEGTYVCCKCSVNECRGHETVLVAEEQKNKEAELRKKSAEIQKQLEMTEQNHLELVENMEKEKVSLRQMSQLINCKFPQLMKLLEEKQEVMQHFLERQQEVTSLEAEERLSVLEQRRMQLSALQDQISRVCSLPTCQLIRDSWLVEVPSFTPLSVDVQERVQEKLSPITEVLTKVSKLLCEDLDRALQLPGVPDKDSSSPQDKRPILAVVPSPATPSFPAERLGLDADYCTLTFDPCTANAHLLLSRDRRRAEHLISGPLDVPDDQSRFEHTWQVLCVESFSHGRHFWELEVSKPWACIGVTYSSIPRKEKLKVCMVGRNHVSWSLQLDERQLSAWHDGRREPVLGQIQGSMRIGVLLDYEAGTLTFFKEGHVRLHAFHCVFTEELYPACWIGEGVSVTLCAPRH